MPAQTLIRAVAVAVALFATGPADAQSWLDALTARPAGDVDPGLPDIPFGAWLDQNVVTSLPRSAGKDTVLVPCPDAADTCLMLEIAIPSRARTLSLTFDRTSQRFLGATVGGPELETMPPIAYLVDLPKRLTAPIRPDPLTCPNGARLVLEEEHAGLREWCEDGAGIRQGPARAWFSTGRYLMHRGTWRDGEKTGRWFECDRFERCRWVEYGV